MNGTSAGSGGRAGATVGARKSPHDRLIEAGARVVGPAGDFAAELSALMANMPLFSGLDPAETDTLCSFMRVYDADPGVTLIREGELGDFMVVLMTGMVDVLRRNRYSYPARIAVASGGQALGEMSLFDGEPRFASCVTLEAARFAVLTRESVLKVLGEESRLGNKILLKLVQMLSERLRQTSAKLVGYLEAAREA